MEIQTYQGQAILPYIDDLARCRIQVFREYPYLYEGDMEYERSYLKALAKSPDSCLVLALDGDKAVGASTALPLKDESDNISAPFLAKKLPVADYFYFGESVLLPEYRGQGIGKRFFEERINAAKAHGAKKAAFCAVIRDEGDPRKPAGYRDLSPLWRKYGFQPSKDLVCTIPWQEIGESEETDKPLRFWVAVLT